MSSQNLESPSEFLGYELGTQFSRHHQVVDYFKYVSDEMSTNVKLVQYGETNERRPLYVTYISSEDNIKNLEQIRNNNLKNAGVIEGDSTPSNIAIVWLSYNVHGNEASSSEASMKTLYALLTKKKDLLKNTVVIIDPCLNPDGRDRYVNWFNRTASTPYNSDQQASEHNEPWPGGRPNHYLFDLNRDWVWATQKETQARLKIYNKWLPQVHVDFHEQGINEHYYFAPAAEPFHEIITDWQRDFQTQIGKNNASYFDKAGWLFFTKEYFDLLYPSYGDTYPTYMGAIGMTFEQAGHGRAGLGVLNDENELLTLTDRIEHHYTTGISTIEVSSQNTEKLNSEFKKFFDNTSRLKYKSFVLQGNSDNIEALKSLLDKHDIHYGYNTSNGKISGYEYFKASNGSLNSTPNDLVVSTNQPKGNIVNVLFEPHTKLVDSLTYDITAWSLPYAYGLDAIASEKLIPSNSKPSAIITNSINPNSVAYMLNWNSLKDAEFLSYLLQQQVNIRFTEKPITTSGLQFNRGSLIITRSDNKTLQDFDTIVIKAANTFHRQLYPIKSGFSTSGPDLGSDNIKIIHNPKVAILTGPNVLSLNYGSLWHFFEAELHFPLTSLPSSNFSNINLNKYHTLLIPEGNYKDIFDKKNLEKLQTWVKSGGKVIAFGSALKIFSNKEEFDLKTTDYKKEEKKDSINFIPYADRTREGIKSKVLGAIYKIKVDNTHPLAFGYPSNYFTLKNDNYAFNLLGKNNFNIAYFGEDTKPISGFAGSDTYNALKNTLVFGEERLGEGNIIYFVDDIMFRGFWENGKLFLANAIFLDN
ncbi:M14 metallopeptidase family protein [Yeosuana marina]|uniref:M14 metallopeptidase family protein n=1 Tax=Yeosuana marina TaxID=1565536 RepID=UPI0030EF37BF|tara:strand:- start:8772 stop:11204 length:2433 start_codon:yes stop_codon:yes gene_type:complete